MCLWAGGWWIDRPRRMLKRLIALMGVLKGQEAGDKRFYFVLSAGFLARLDALLFGFAENASLAVCRNDWNSLNC